MEFNNKKLVRTSKIVNHIISIALCGFLISLSGKLINDVDQWKERPVVEQFENKTLLDSLTSEVDKIDEQLDIKFEEKAKVEKTMDIANSNYLNAKKSFDNWLEARNTVGSQSQNKEVLSRAEELDEFYKTEQTWRNKVSVLEEDIFAFNKQKGDVIKLVEQEESRAYKERNKANRKYELNVFLIRLLFILPILLLGIFFIIKFRKSKYWPLFFGFVLFSFYAFFFGLVPYLPSYGGYIRYTVGILLSLALGAYFINFIKAFIERQKNELKVSQAERSDKVQLETAEKALDNHMCPSCGKDFILMRWDKSLDKKTKIKSFGAVTNFCRYCGLELFKKCNNCESENFALLPYCSNCGDEINKK